MTYSDLSENNLSFGPIDERKWNPKKFYEEISQTAQQIRDHDYLGLVRLPEWKPWDAESWKAAEYSDLAPGKYGAKLNQLYDIL